MKEQHYFDFQIATEADIDTISAIAEATWLLTYGSIVSAQQLVYMFEWMYDAESLRQQMARGVVFLLLYKDNAADGFAAYEVLADGRARVHKLYFRPSAQGQGLGKLLLAEVCQRAVAQHCAVVELNVNRANAAVYFYQKMDFHIVREVDLDVGNGFFMNDFVMEKQLK